MENDVLYNRIMNVVHEEYGPPGEGGGLDFNSIVDKSEPTGAVKLSTAETIGAYGVCYFNGITSLFSDSVQTISGEHGIAHNDNLEYVVMANPNFNFTNATYTISENSKLKAIDLKNLTLGINATTFRNNTKWDTFILRKSSVVQLDRPEAFYGTPFASKGTGGTLYVPQDLISSYQSASNWSTILGYANNQIKSIESTHTDPNAPIDLTLYYVDGTPIPTP